MKNKKLIVTISVVLFIFLPILIYLNKSQDLAYIKGDSSLNEFYFEDDYVVFDCNIKIKNNTSKSYYFTIEGDLSNEAGLTKEDTAKGYEKETNKDTFFIEENSEMIYRVEFKALKGDSIEKSNRLPPEDIFIKIKE